jgi:GR25 family glycosyltransferase involved in LPS biosynthesis
MGDNARQPLWARGVSVYSGLGGAAGPSIGSTTVKTASADIEALVLHLERASERRGQVARIFAALNMPAQIIPAVDGKLLTALELRCYRPDMFKPHYPFELTLGEIGCFLSHRQCWEHIVVSGKRGALIIEDDVEIAPEAFSSLLPLVLSAIPLGAYVRFPHKPGRESGTSVLMGDGFEVFEPISPGLGTVGQFVSRDAAQALLAASNTFDRPVDAFLQLRKLHNVRILSTSPCVMRDVSVGIGASLVQTTVRPLTGRLHRELVRPLYRMRVRHANRILNR